MIDNNLINFEKSKPESEVESFVFNKLRKYVITDSIKELLKNVDVFLKRKQSFNVHFKFESNSKHSFSDNQSNINFKMNDESDDETIQTNDEYLEILKLRHLNFSVNSMVGESYSNQKTLSKNIFLITGSRGMGKSSVIAFIYKQLCLVKSLNLGDTSLQFESTFTLSTSQTLKLNSNRVHEEPLYLFYFLKPKDHLKSILIDIIIKMRLKYLNKSK